MSEKITNDHIAVNTEEGQILNLHKIYIKDMSFESPNTPMVFMDEWDPEAKFDMQTNVGQLPNGHFDVTLHLTLTVKNKDKTAYLVEVMQAGIFELVGYTEDEAKHILGSFAPSTLYPYARQQISNLTLDGGFAPYLVAPVNFDRLFHDYLKEQENKIAAAE